MNLLSELSKKKFTRFIYCSMVLFGIFPYSLNVKSSKFEISRSLWIYSILLTSVAIICASILMPSFENLCRKGEPLHIKIVYITSYIVGLGIMCLTWKLILFNNKKLLKIINDCFSIGNEIRNINVTRSFKNNMRKLTILLYCEQASLIVEIFYNILMGGSTRFRDYKDIFSAYVFIYIWSAIPIVTSFYFIGNYCICVYYERISSSCRHIGITYNLSFSEGNGLSRTKTENIVKKIVKLINTIKEIRKTYKKMYNMTEKHILIFLSNGFVYLLAKIYEISTTPDSNYKTTAYCAKIIFLVAQILLIVASLDRVTKCYQKCYNDVDNLNLCIDYVTTSGKNVKVFNVNLLLDDGRNKCCGLFNADLPIALKLFSKLLESTLLLIQLKIQ